MKAKFLLPNKSKYVGWLFLVVSIVLFYVKWKVTHAEYSILESGIPISNLDDSFYSFFSNTSFKQFFLTDTFVGILFIVGGLIVSFSREKIEDEYIAKLRLSSFQWAFLANYVLLLLCFIFIYGMSFLAVMCYNMFTTMILFIVRFNFLVWLSKRKQHEE